MSQSDLEAHMALIIRVLIQDHATWLSEPETEHRFHTRRKWRFDFAWPTHMIAIEVEGGQWTGGRHQRGKGFEDDCEKYNEATLFGWRVYRFTGDQITRGDALALLERIFPPF